MTESIETTQPTETREIADATAESFFAAVCPKVEKVLPGIGRVWIHGLTELENFQWLESCERDPDNPDRLKDPYQVAKLIQRSVRDRSGRPIFAANQIARIVNLPNILKAALAEEARRLTGLGDEIDEEILGNCVPTPISGS